MVNPFHEVDWQPDRRARRRFALSLLVGCPIIAVLLLVAARLQGAEGTHAAPLIVGLGGAALGLLLWVVPGIARPIYVAWYAVACAMGFVIGNLALAAIFFLLFTPLGLALRLCGRRTFRKEFDREAPTYWRDAPPARKPEAYYRQF